MDNRGYYQKNSRGRGSKRGGYDHYKNSSNRYQKNYYNNCEDEVNENSSEYGKSHNNNSGFKRKKHECFIELSNYIKYDDKLIDVNFKRNNKLLISTIQKAFDSLKENYLLYLISEVYIKEDYIYIEVLNDLFRRDQEIKHIIYFNHLFSTSTLNSRELNDEIEKKIACTNPHVLDIIMNYKVYNNELQFEKNDKNLRTFYFDGPLERRRKLLSDNASIFYF